MIKINDKNISSVYYGEKVIGKIYKGLVKVYESWRNLLVSGIPPLTLTKCKGELPGEYQQVEYIESTGTQYIDTGLKSNQISKVSMDFEFTSMDKTYNLLFGSQQNVNGQQVRNQFNMTPTKISFTNGIGSACVFDVAKTINTNTRYYFIGNFGTNGSFNINGEVTECKGDGAYSSLNAYIFCYNYLGNASLHSKIKLYELKTWDMSGKLSRHYIPCYRKSDNAIGLYDLVNDMFYTNSGTGVFLKGLDASMGMNLIDYKIDGNSVQEGTPTTDVPIEVENVGEYDETTGKYKIPVRVRGKNLYASGETYSKERENGYTVSATINKSTVNINGTSDRDYGFYLTTFKDITPAGTYKVSVHNLNKGDRIYVGDGNGNILINYIEINAPKQFTIDTSKKLQIYGVFAKGSTYNNADIKIQIETGEVTDYEPYAEPITTSIYLNKPLRKIGNYIEYIKFLDKNGSRRIEEDIYDGTEQWEVVGIEGESSSYYGLRKGEYGSVVASVGLSTHFKRTSVTSSNYNIGFNVINSSGYNQARICIRPDITKYSTLKLWKEFLSKQYENGTPVKVYYVLTTPIEETIELPNIPTFKGTTILEVDTDIQPSNMEVVYKGKA